VQSREGWPVPDDSSLEVGQRLPIPLPWFTWGDPLGFPRFFPIESPRISIRWALWTSRPRTVPRRRAVVPGIGFIGVGLISVREDREQRNAGKINLNRGIMRALLIWQSPSSRLAQQRAVLLTNSTRPAGTDFQSGELFEIVVTAAAKQPVSVRRTMKCRTDWGPVVGWADLSGR
jgi:hypothetical protein